MTEDKQLKQVTHTPDLFLEKNTPPTSRDPEVLENAIERHLDGWGHVSFVEFAKWLGESYRGNCFLTDAHDPNIVFWGNFCPEIVEALNILIQAGRVELRAASCWTNELNGGISELPTAEIRPPEAGYAGPIWHPVMLIIPQDRSRFNSALCYGIWK